MKSLIAFCRRLKNRLLLKLQLHKKVNINELSELKLHLGCGGEYKQGWVNIDINPSVRTDITCDFASIKEHFKKDTVNLVYMMHSISYLKLWEARIFFKDVYGLLKDGGILEMEFPDIVKCSTVITATTNSDEYVEAVRGIYAFDLDQMKNKEHFTPYSFGWSGWFIKEELQKIGFKNIQVLDPETHGKRVWRDTRIVAEK